MKALRVLQRLARSEAADQAFRDWQAASQKGDQGGIADASIKYLLSAGLDGKYVSKIIKPFLKGGLEFDANVFCAFIAGVGPQHPLAANVASAIVAKRKIGEIDTALSNFEIAGEAAERRIEAFGALIEGEAMRRSGAQPVAGNERPSS